MRRLLPLLVLAACAEFPPEIEARLAEAQAAAPPPSLVPLGTLLAPASALPAEPAFAPELQAQAEALQAQAAALPPGPDSPTDAERLAALAARAETLREAGLTEAERDRLLSDPAAP